MHEHTLGSLKEWYKRHFNRIGFIFLAAVKGHSEKRVIFLSESEVLLKALREKHSSTNGQDLKRDLLIMSENVEKMHDIVKNHNMSVSDMVNFNGYEGKVEPLTFHSISRMYKGIFQKLGWALLGTSHGHSDKLKCLMGSFSYLHLCLSEIISDFKEKDKKRDLEIMHDHVKTILSIVFTKDKISGSLTGTVPVGIVMSPVKSPRSSPKSSGRSPGRSSPRGGSGRRSLSKKETESVPEKTIVRSPNRTANSSMSSSIRPAGSRPSASTKTVSLNKN